MFSIEFSTRAKKSVKKLDLVLRKRIGDKIRLLKDDPVPHDSKRIEGEERSFRIRIGFHRVLYDVDWDTKIIVIAKIDQRERSYKK